MLQSVTDILHAAGHWQLGELPNRKVQKPAPTKPLGDSPEGVSKKIVINFHGKIISQNGNNYFVTYHPSAVMRFPTIKLKMSKDFEKLGNLMKRKK